MSEIIERLKHEKKLSEGNYVERGKNDGLEWAKKAHYNDLMHALEMDCSLTMATDSLLSRNLSRTIESDLAMDITSEGLNRCARLYVDGWRKGIAEFWTIIQEKL